MRAVLFCCVVYVVVGQDVNDMLNMPKYDQRYDYLDVDAIFTNKRLIRNYVDCLINAQRCSPEGKALKRILPEALRTKCVRCTEHQKRMAVKIIKRLKNEYPQEWAKLASRWDPTGDFTRYFEEFLDRENFNTIPGSGITNPTPSQQTAPPLPPVPPTMDIQPTATNQVSPPRPIILNRFGDEEEVMSGSGSSVNLAPTPSPTQAQATTRRTTTMRPFFPRPVPPRPTSMTWPSDSETTQFPSRAPTELPQPYSTAITLIDQIGFKIIRTTELFTDLLKNTVRAVVGR